MKNDLLELIGDMIRAMKDQDAANAELAHEVARLQGEIEDLRFSTALVLLLATAYLFWRTFKRD